MSSTSYDKTPKVWPKLKSFFYFFSLEIWSQNAVKRSRSNERNAEESR